MMGARDFLTPLTWTSLWFLQLPEQCRLMHIQPPKKKNKHKHKQSRTQDPVPPGKKQLLQTRKPNVLNLVQPSSVKNPVKFLMEPWTPKFS